VREVVHGRSAPWPPNRTKMTGRASCLEDRGVRYLHLKTRAPPRRRMIEDMTVRNFVEPPDFTYRLLRFGRLALLARFRQE
jgi:hypothetical protein